MALQTRASPKELIRHRGRHRKQSDVGYLFKAGGSWYVRYYTGVMVAHTKRDSSTEMVREQKCHRLGATADMTKDQAKIARNTYLKPMTSSRGVVHSTITISQYVEDVILKWWERNLKPSTLDGYKKSWHLYIEPVMGDQPIGEFTTVDAGNFLDRLVLKGLTTTTIAHIRNVANIIFNYAATKGVITANPFAGAVMTEKAKQPQKTYKCSMQEVHDILLALDGNRRAQTAVGLCFFAGLRPGEARAAKWENYDGVNLRIEQSAWKKFITAPKTADSVQSIPVVAPLRELLSQLREEQGNPTEGYILRGDNGGPLNLDFLARAVIRPTLKARKIEWHSWYSLRRGLATVATDAIRDPQGAAGMLRHKTIDVTAQKYIGIPKETTQRAMTEFERLYTAIDKQLPAGV
ncbi:MAG: hypothetical protein LAO09_12120 [Acidobacteriia bacterium]|nr:hypothetical protein [Terriglobia bacterium]